MSMNVVVNGRVWTVTTKAEIDALCEWLKKERAA